MPVIDAVVPYTEYSVSKTLGTRNLDHADQLVLKILEIINYFMPQIWWIENPRYGFLKDRNFMQDKPFLDIMYGHFIDWITKTQHKYGGANKLKNCPPEFLSLVQISFKFFMRSPS